MNNILIIFPYLKGNKLSRNPDEILEEMVSLARSLSLNTVQSEALLMKSIKAATCLGKGVIERYRTLIQENNAKAVVLACRLTPLQQRNLEKAWQTKVIDKTALILEIFGQRARTKEGILQVELAHLIYARSRLARSWTHLERQRGGSGFLGGPGETQIELDRRLIDEKIVKIKKKLEEVKKTRALHRRARKKVPYPVIALTGYTNAGKSTLFNYLTHAGVLSEDKLFATLDPTMRLIKLPSGQPAILSDTVGFISDLPAELIMAFRATLEEVTEADAIIHVRDYHHSGTAAQKKDVEQVLNDLGLGERLEDSVLEALNKIDLFDQNDKKMIVNQKKGKSREWPVSAKTGEGVADLLNAVEEVLNKDRKKVKLKIPLSDGKTLARLYQKGQVLSRKTNKKSITVLARLKAEDMALFQACEDYPKK